MLKLVIDCDADAAWRAIHSPRAVAELYGPLLAMEPLDPPLPTSWEAGSEAAVQLSLAGLLPLGQQTISVSERTVQDRHGTVRIFRDHGKPTSGVLSTLDVWDHQMAVSPAPKNASKTLWRDRLVIGGPTAPALWPVLWATWQWRAARIAAMAPSWAHDLDDA